MTIRVLSFDFDGCLFNKKYRDSPHASTASWPTNFIHKSESDLIISSNQELVDYIIAENHATPYNQVITMIGSNRQSLNTDMVNMVLNQNGSCFIAIQQITSALNAKFDDFLMADAYKEHPNGTAYQKALAAVNFKSKNSDTILKAEGHDEWFFDESKVTLLYAQMHHIAHKNPSECINFCFYDDSSDVLDSIQRFFNQYPELIPANTKIQPYCYDGEGVEEYTQIQGTGPIDQAYKNTAKQMGQIVLSCRGTKPERIRICDLEYLTPDKLTERQYLLASVEVSRTEASSVSYHTTSSNPVSAKSKEPKQTSPRPNRASISPDYLREISIFEQAETAPEALQISETDKLSV